MNEFLKQLHDVYVKSGATITYDEFKSKIQESQNDELKIDGNVAKLSKLIESFQKKRRGEEVQESFKQMEQMFESIVKFLVQLKHPCLESEFNKPFAKELFDKYLIKEEDGFKMKDPEKIFDDFILFKQWWKPKFAEGKPLDRFIMSTSRGMNIYIEKYIFEKECKDPASMYLMPSNNFMSTISEGIDFIKPRTKILNETLMPSWTKLIAKGKVCINESLNEMRIEFQSEEISGMYKAIRESDNSDFWVLQKIN
jgi:hypothetical protein